MEMRIFLCLLFLVCLTCFLSSTEGYKFYVGGRDGWVLKPSENYIHWAERNRFQVNDTLYFKYNKGSDSVLVVNKDNYFNCNTSNPIQKLEEGNSEFKFDRSGPFYFISGQDGNCAKGQKLIIIVLAVRHPKIPPATPSSPTPPGPGSAPSAAPSSGPSPSQAPGSAPSAAPSSGPSPSHAPGSAPSSAPAVPSSSPSHAPTTSPVPAPAAGTTPTSSPPGLEPTPSGDISPSGDVTSPSPGSSSGNSTTPEKKNGAFGVTASSVMVSSVIVLVSLALTGGF